MKFGNPKPWIVIPQSSGSEDVKVYKVTQSFEVFGFSIVTTSGGGWIKRTDKMEDRDEEVLNED